MSLRLGALQDALIDAGANEALADYERQVAAIRTDLAVIKWMLGTNVAVAIATLWRVFS